MNQGKVILWHDVDPEIIDTPEIKGVHKRVVISDKQGAENFFLRVFTVSPGGYSPRHAHSWEHEVFVLRGQGRVLLKDKYSEVSPGYAVFIPENIEHQFINTSETEEFEFICVIPKGGG